ncbi:MAG: hypothetical protein N2505_00080 [Endomicrobia bacterium]|nr:hypothetical protein [Endomicrobiia bacterium]
MNPHAFNFVDEKLGIKHAINRMFNGKEKEINEYMQKILEIIENTKEIDISQIIAEHQKTVIYNNPIAYSLLTSIIHKHTQKRESKIIDIKNITNRHVIQKTFKNLLELVV